jgi:hypothetical protein
MNGLKDVVGIISFKKENPNLLMHEIIFLIHTFDFQVALSISWDRVSLEEMTWSKYLMHAIIIFVLQGCLVSSDLQAAFGQAAFGVLQCTLSISFINLVCNNS